MMNSYDINEIIHPQISFAMGVKISYSKSYFWLNSWVLANIIQLSTQSFCRRFITHEIDPGRRLFDQMTMAARSAVANIAEGSSRHSTSIETEMRLSDVSRGSVDELFGDYFNFLMSNNLAIWPAQSPTALEIWRTSLDTPHYGENLISDVADHIKRQKAKYDKYTESADAATAANALLLMCERLNRMLQSQMDRQLEQFKADGGFTENMTQERLASRKEHAAGAAAPSCPVCGAPMLRRMVKKGSKQGSEFWGCSDYPRCQGTRPL